MTSDAALQFLGPGGAAKHLGMSRANAYRLIDRSRFPDPDAVADGHPLWTASTLDEWSANRPGPPLAPCGTRTAYNRHLRRGESCGECREANRVATAAFVRRMRHAAAAGERPTPHGTTNGYSNYGCRCPECKAAGSRNNAAQRAKRKAKAS